MKKKGMCLMAVVFLALMLNTSAHAEESIVKTESLMVAESIETADETEIEIETELMWESASETESVAETETIQETAREESQEELIEKAGAYSGFVTINGHLYYYDPSTGERLKGLQVVDGDTYYFQKSGAAAAGRQTINGLPYYFNPVTYKQMTGIVEVDYGTVKRKHYFLVEGGLASGWVEENGKKYYFSSPETGSILLTGVQKIDDKTYYFDLSTGEAREGICENSKGQKYYFTLEGEIKTGLQEWQGDLYYCKAGQSGAVQYGFQSLGTRLYYFDNNTGAALKNVKITSGNINFLLNEEGVVIEITPKEGYENNKRVQLIVNGLKRLGEEDVFCGQFTKEVCQVSGFPEVTGASYEQAHAIVNHEYGMLIEQSELRMGDMVFWTWDNCGNSNCEHWEEIHHVGFYLGNGKVLEAASTDGTVAEGGTIQVQNLRSYSGFEIKYCVRLVDDSGDEFLDEDSQQIILGKTKNLKAASAGKQRVKLTWDAVDKAEGYLVYGQKNGKYGYVGMTTRGTTFTDTKALDTDYNFYWVFPYVKDANGKMKPGGCEKYTFGKGVCLAITNLKSASAVGGVKLTWAASAGAEGYLVYGMNEANSKYHYIGMTTRGTTFTDRKASKTDYNFYWVYPYHKNAEGKMIIGGTPKYVYGKAR